MACRKEKGIIDRSVNWLHQMNALVDQLEKTCEEIQYTIDDQPPMPVPHEIQERARRISSGIQEVMTNLQGEKCNLGLTQWLVCI
ncbi:MAG TPA: hypothetical protein VN372_01560 [Methanospirillum sp.]|nr:hypothetical protein [Methanospirillum sp.]